jgi:tetratricopeptide (TPR) repeat protein
MARKKQLTPAAAFQAVVRTALEHFHEPAWLAAHSPLAEAYFLADRLSADTLDAAARGAALQALLRAAWARLWPGPRPGDRAALLRATEEARRREGNSGDIYACLLLELRYFRAYFSAADYPAQAGDIPIFLNVSTTRFFVHLEEAIDRLADQVLQLARPALRLERPRRPSTFVGREALREQCRAALLAGHSATISGVAGVGKTTLAAAVAGDWPTPATFWYTFLPGINDNLPGLLFALGYFIHQWTPSALWLQLMADQGQVRNPSQLLAILRADLEQLRSYGPLLCFDEVDLLRTSDGETRSATHAQLLTFLEGLCAATPVLLVGQQGYIDTPVHITLEPLVTTDTAALLREGGVAPQTTTLNRVQQVTGGLPRLIELVIALLRGGDDLSELDYLHARADVRPLFHRLWRRLDPAEQELLVSLSVLRRPAPLDVVARASAYEQLLDRRVVQAVADEVGVQPYFRGLIYEALPPEQREAAHAQAARLRALRGDYTAAAYHYSQAGDAVAAIDVWFPHRELEIRRGQGGAAQAVFSRLSAARLPAPHNRRLRLIQNQLDLLEGNAERVASSMARLKWDLDDIYAAEAHRQAAEANFILGRYDTALNSYGQAIAALGHYADVAAETYSRRGQLYIDLGEMTAARAEARRARLRVLLLEGMLAFNEGDFPAAQRDFQAALDQTATLDAPELTAQAHEWLATTAIMSGDVATAERHGAAALAYHQRTGNRVKQEGLRADLAGMYLNVRQFERVIEPSRRALRYFEEIGHERWVSSICSNLAEAYLELGQLDEAMSHAQRVLQLENPHSRPYALYTLGLIHQRQGRAEYAAAAFEDGLRVARRNSDTYIEAFLQRNLGRLHRQEGRAMAAAAALAAALDLFRRMNLAAEVATTEAELLLPPSEAAGDEPPPA